MKVHNLPNFLRVHTPGELKSKIEFLENNQRAYDALLAIIDNVIKKDHKSGKVLDDMIKSFTRFY